MLEYRDSLQDSGRVSLQDTVTPQIKVDPVTPPGSSDPSTKSGYSIMLYAL